MPLTKSFRRELLIDWVAMALVVLLWRGDGGRGISTVPINAQAQAQPDQQLACVTMRQYKHRDCQGSPISIRNYTVWTQPGRPCKHTDRMVRYQV